MRALLVTAAALAVAAAPAACQPAETVTPTPVTTPSISFRPGVHNAPYVDGLQTICDGHGNVEQVTPDTPAGRARAVETCANFQHSLEDIGWGP